MSTDGSTLTPAPSFKKRLLKHIHKLWLEAGEPCPRLSRFVRYRVLKNVLPPPESPFTSFAMQPRFVSSDQIPVLAEEPPITVVLVVEDCDERSLHHSMNSVVEQAYSNWQLYIVGTNAQLRSLHVIANNYQAQYGDKIINVPCASSAAIPAVLQAQLATITTEYVVVHHAPDILHCDALSHFALATERRAQALYCDHHLIHGDRQVTTKQQPPFSPESLLSLPGLGTTQCWKTVVLQKMSIGTLAARLVCFEALLKLGTLPSYRVQHIPLPLYSVTERFIDLDYHRQEIVDRFRSSRQRQQPTVAILVPYIDSASTVERTVQHLKKMTLYRNYTIHLVDCGSTHAATFASLSTSSSSSSSRYEAPVSEALDKAIAATDADYIVVLTEGIEVDNCYWLKKLVETAGISEHIAAVSGGAPDANHGQAPHNVHMLSGPCVLLSKAIYMTSRGFSTVNDFVENYTSRAYAQGFRLVVEPSVSLRAAGQLLSAPPVSP